MQRTILFVDDNDILYRSGTKRILSQPKRHQSNPLIKTDRPWEVAIGWTSIYRDPETGKYQLWYQAFAGDQAEQKTHRCVVCYAISDDGIHFSKPDLDQFAFNDIEHTNIVLVGNGGHSLRYANSVIYDPKETEPQKRYKMAYFDFSKNNGLETPGLCVAFSPDGINWTKHPQAPLLKVSYGDYGTPVPLADYEPETTNNRSWDVPLSMSDAVDVLYDPKSDLFVIYGKMWIDAPDGGMYWKHGMGRTTSKNFIDWSKPELICVPDEFDPPHLEFHTTPVFFYQDVYFCLNQILNRAEGGGVIDIELGISRGTASTGVVRSENRFLFHAQAQRPKIERARSRRINSIAARSSPIPLLSFWRMKSDFIMAVTQRARPVRTITRMSAALAW